MEIENNIFSYPSNDENKRFIIGKKGKINILIIGLNPSTADTNKHDPTTKNIDKIAKENGYDGWFLVNLCSKRSSKPENLIIKNNENLISENLNFIFSFLYLNKYQIKNVWLAWGDNINKINKPILMMNAYNIYKKIERFNLNYFSIGLTKKNNPFHPSPRVTNTKFKNRKIKFIEFNFKAYSNKIKREINLPPDITY